MKHKQESDQWTVVRHLYIFQLPSTILRTLHADFVVITLNQYINIYIMRRLICADVMSLQVLTTLAVTVFQPHHTISATKVWPGRVQPQKLRRAGCPRNRGPSRHLTMLKRSIKHADACKQRTSSNICIWCEYTSEQCFWWLQNRTATCQARCRCAYTLVQPVTVDVLVVVVHSHMAGAMQGKTLPKHASKHTSCVQKGVKDSCSWPSIPASKQPLPLTCRINIIHQAWSWADESSGQSC